MTNTLITNHSIEDDVNSKIAGFFNAATITVAGFFALLTVVATI